MQPHRMVRRREDAGPQRRPVAAHPCCTSSPSRVTSRRRGPAPRGPGSPPPRPRPRHGVSAASGAGGGGPDVLEEAVRVLLRRCQAAAAAAAVPVYYTSESAHAWGWGRSPPLTHSRSSSLSHIKTQCAATTGSYVQPSHGAPTSAAVSRPRNLTHPEPSRRQPNVQSSLPLGASDGNMKRSPSGHRVCRVDFDRWVQWIRDSCFYCCVDFEF